MGYEDELGGMSPEAAMLLLCAAIYAYALHHLGRHLERRGHKLIGDRLSSIGILSIGYLAIGFIIAGFGVMFTGGFGTPWASALLWAGKVGGFAFGIRKGWKHPVES